MENFQKMAVNVYVYGQRNKFSGMVVYEMFESGTYEIDTSSFVIRSKDKEY